MTGIKLTLSSITRTAAKPSADGGAAGSEKATYYRGNPKFDEYESKMKAMVPAGDALPKNFMGPGALCSTGDATNLSRQITDVMELYHRGYAGTAEVEKVLSRVVADVRSTYAGMGFDPDEFTGKLIEDVYGIARLGNTGGAASASWYEGRPIAQAHNNGRTGSTRDWVYYDAGLYYDSEEMKGTLQDMARKIGAKYGVTQLNLSTDYPAGDVRKGIYSSYNTAISDRMRNDCRIGNLLDEAMAPPKGLKFFYMANDGGWDPFVTQLPGPKNDPYSAFDSFLSVSYGDWSFTGRVPVRMDATQFPISVNMLDVVSRGTGGRVPQAVSAFLKNVDFFSPVQSGPYMSSHPRKF